MDFLPWARILLRYGIGYLAGAEVGEQLALDPDLVAGVALAMAAAVEGGYVWAKKRGGAT